MGKVKKFLKILGPGFITGASDDDPSGIATYSQTGAQFGYQQLWATLFTIPFMTVVQEMCGRIGLVTGKGLAGVIRKHYSKPFLFAAVFILFFANIINIGADLGAMASSAQLVFKLPFAVWLIGMTVVTLILEVFVSYRLYSQFLKYLALSLFAYIFTVFIIKQDWMKIFVSTLVPSISFSKDYILNIVAFLGTTISPYLFFWQAGEEVEEEVEEKKLRTMGLGKPTINIRTIRKMRADTLIGMVFSNLISFFIIITTASTLAQHGIKTIESADQAALALQPIAGNLTFILFAVGIIGTGLLAVPVLAGSASYALAEAFGLKEGLYRKFTQAHGFYGIITIATLIGLLVNFTHVKPFQMLYYTAALNGISAPLLLVFIIVIANNKKIMGKYTNSLPRNIAAWTITGVMTLASLGLLLFLIK